ncbi:V-type ATP synthase subunit D [Marinobacterium sediminicola]|uniref:V/A-type H+-transporting ATPase subunit D n=1 Tax=Marinobacterium sediminicola TaxID=518898 RepID=A0ABY1S0N8_9GAMM|nr:V-type ATP synthase subunit D [Marinobacterium sediminicola]ULG69582.1 V-type ATP synthase subunit D [Marinobacterium sediminicola]SMR74690.1 V/A-type H+-transporting ATPase subunit D [Marinobacterium sediminicola]
MGKLALNKSTLNHENQRLKSFRQFVPALDLKRKQILAARLKSRRALADFEMHMQQVNEAVAVQLPMLAGTSLDLGSLVQLRRVHQRTDNLVGIELPVVERVEIDSRQYSRLALPQWVDILADRLRQMLELKVRHEVELLRLERLESALQKTTQRLNLFDKVLIPRTEANIRRIRIALSDAERAGVVRAKIAKNKRARMAMS